MIFIAKSENKNLGNNNPGQNNVVKFWFKIPAENHVCQQVQNHVRGPIENRT